MSHAVHDYIYIKTNACFAHLRKVLLQVDSYPGYNHTLPQNLASSLLHRSQRQARLWPSPKPAGKLV